MCLFCFRENEKSLFSGVVCHSGVSACPRPGRSTAPVPSQSPGWGRMNFRQTGCHQESSKGLDFLQKGWGALWG